MKRKRHTPEPIVKHPREADRMLGEGKTVGQVCKRIGVTEVTYYRWRKEYDGATRDSVKRLQDPGEGECAARAPSGGSGAGEPDAEGHRGGKLLGPHRKRQAVATARERHVLSERRACQIVGGLGPRNATRDRREQLSSGYDARFGARLESGLDSGAGA